MEIKTTAQHSLKMRKFIWIPLRGVCSSNIMWKSSGSKVLVSCSPVTHRPWSSSVVQTEGGTQGYCGQELPSWCCIDGGRHLTETEWNQIGPPWISVSQRPGWLRLLNTPRVSPPASPTSGLTPPSMDSKSAGWVSLRSMSGRKQSWASRNRRSLQNGTWP